MIIALGLVVRIAQDWPDENLHIIFCDVGQGDAILLKYGFWQMLIDAGYNDSVLDCLNQHLPFWDKQIEVVVITHPHSDHFGGLPDVLENYQIKDLILTDVADTEEFKNLLFLMKTTQSSQAMFRNGVLGRKISFSPAGELLVLSPFDSQINAMNASIIDFSETMLSDVRRAEYAYDGDLNERSIVLLLRYFEFEMLLMGDATIKNELALIERGLIGRVEGIKIGHHGSNTSTSKLFVTTTQPEFSVISCGLNNRFGHPSLEVVQTLQENFSQVWRTDEIGSIHLVTNGQYYWLLE